MALVPKRRSCGLGLQELINKIYRDVSLRKILLEVRADNAATINLYGTMGFRTVRDSRDNHFDGLDHDDLIVKERMIGNE